ncbi:(d)CMP kinase [Hugenholtzia roseola]|uniref:(d)CMP kinase n=1 Tax=Hugenholtzia roseola TaxID=1002 RepID=UPI00047ED507|nr:(d)CMP kinase [Hugenholtzia roseola]
MEKIIIAIDGYSACGKSSTAKAVAAALGYRYIDTGAMYRAVTLYFLRQKMDYQTLSQDAEAFEKVLTQIHLDFEWDAAAQKSLIFLNGENVEDQIRTPEVATQVSPVSTISAVRRFLVAQQREIGKNKALVMDGRDIGTVVFPDAELKVFMTAQMEVRAERRRLELAEKNIVQSLPEIIQNLAQRDTIDSSREDSPLRQADDAFLLDTSFLTFEQQVEKILAAFRAYQEKKVNEVKKVSLTS